MSEKIYSWLLRLFPRSFRQNYRDEALQLYRDRARDEKGFLPTLRLWCDLLADLAISVPHQHWHRQPAPIVASAHGHLAGKPAFHVFEDEAPRFVTLLYGGVLSLVVFGSISIVIGHDGNHRPLRARSRQLHTVASARASAGNPPTQLPADVAGEETITSGPPMTTASSFMDDRTKPHSFSPRDQLPRKTIPNTFAGYIRVNEIPPSVRSFGTEPPPTIAADDDRKLDAAERQRVIDAAIANLRRYYIYRDVANKVTARLLALEKSGDYNTATDGAAFAALLTKQMRDTSQDMHLIIEYSQAKIPEHPESPSPERLAGYRRAMEQTNCTVEKVAVLPHNIGYLKLNSFPDVSVCRSTVVAAMVSLNHADALIFDLRDNTGGSPDMVALIAAYLFDHPEYLYNPRESPTPQSWTRSPVPGNSLADKPVYVLTSASTFSGAEQFSYDLKMLKRATLVGETTRGGAHAGVFHRIDDHFGIGIPEVIAVNPFAPTDWEGTGVEPDIRVQAADALETAVRLAQSKIRNK